MKRVLIITYYWPPSGGSGVQRWLLTSKYLPENGWQPVIYTADTDEYPVEDPSLEKEVPKEAEVIRRPILEPYSFYKKFLGINKEVKIKPGLINEGREKSSWKEKISLWIRGNLFIPDARCLWIKPSVRFLKKYLKEHPVDVIISTGPPHSMHLIALKLHEKLGTPWVADFRDPWTEFTYYNDFLLTKRSDKKQHELERKVLSSANEVVTVSQSWADSFSKLGSCNAKVITNGFDCEINDDFEGKKLSKKFTISHIGILSSKRNPENFWKAIKELAEENKDFKNALEIRFIGQIDRSVKESIKQNGLEKCTMFNSYLPHEEAIKMQQESQVLLASVSDTPSARGVVAGKIFEYLASGRPIIAIGPEDSDTAKIINEADLCANIGFTDIDKMKATIKTLYQYYKGNKLHTKANPNIWRFSRKALTSEYVSLLNSITSTHE